jgi:uncharacterized protein (TIGR03437 family)
VALSSDGNTALIGGPYDNSAIGAAWVFTRASGVWAQQQELVGTGAIGTGAQQGTSVALSGDGATALLGGPYDDPTGSGMKPPQGVGAVWVFTLSGSTWSQQTKLVGTPYSGLYGYQGSSAALSSDGNIALSGGPGDDSNGAVWVFTRSGSTWTQNGAQLVGSGATGDANQGTSVALSAANIVIIGGPDDNSFTGGAWIFALPSLSVTAPASTAQGTSFNITVTAYTPTGAVDTGYSDLVQFTSTDGAAVLPSSSTLTNGTGQFPVTLNTAGTQTITATDTTFSTVTATSATVTVASAVAPPMITKVFGAVEPLIRKPRAVRIGIEYYATVPLNGSIPLAFSIQNPNASSALTGVGFTDSFPAGLVVASPNGLTGTCGGGTITALAGGSSVSLSGATLAATSTCSFSVTVIGTIAGDIQNVTSAVTSNEGGPGSAASAFLTVVAPPALSEVFGAPDIPLNGSTTLAFTVSNPARGQLTGVGFNDALPAGLVVSTPNGLTGTCGGGTIAATAGSGSVNLSGATLSGTCNFSLNVTGTTAGTKVNATTTVTSTEGGTGNTASATVTVLAPPVIAKVFGTPAIVPNGSTTLAFTVTNPNSTAQLTGVGFTDPLPPGLAVSSPNGLTGACGGGAITAAAGGGGVSLSGATLAANSSCLFAVNVTGSTIGTKNNVTGAVTSNEGGAGNTASASLTVSIPAPPLLAVSFGEPSIPVSGVTSLTYTITNPPANSIALTGVGFTDVLAAGLTVAGNVASTCGGSLAAAVGSGSVALAGATIAAAGSCKITVNVVAALAGLYNNLTTVVSANAGSGNTASAQLNVLGSITLQTVPAGLSIRLDGTVYSGASVLQLAAGGTHTISVTTPQPGPPGTRYVFNNWSDGGAVSHTIVVPATPATYTVTFTTQYELTVAVTPSGSGSVTPASGGFYNAGASVSLTAVANAGYAFTGWTGAANPAGSATATVAMSGPQSVTASFQVSGAPPPPVDGLLNGGSFQQGQAAPNTILSLFGANLSCTPAPQVLVNDVPAQVLFASATQINFVVPAGLGSTGNASVQIVCNGVTTQAGTLAFASVNPSIFTQTENGIGQGAVLNLNYSLNGPQSPGIPGSYLLVFGTGFGDLGPAGADGLQRLILPVTATIGGVAAQVVYAGEAPFFTSGLQQINILIPEGAPTGLTVPIQLFVNGASTQSGVTIAIQ